jgi:hypothetical protein
MILESIESGNLFSVYRKTGHVVFDGFISFRQNVAQLGPDVNKRVAMLS